LLKSAPVAFSQELRIVVDWFDREAEHGVAVAFSGGVDSSVVLAAAFRSRARPVLALTARSPSVAGWQLDWADKVAKQIGAEHVLVDTNEVDLPHYSVNDSRRCYFCKHTLYQHLDRWLRKQGHNHTVVVSGTNADDLGDYRPGIQAGREAAVRTPLAELGYGKSLVRKLAAELGLANADLPASPCLASRIAYGVAVTPERLRRIEQAEATLWELGLGDLRVRLHEGELARIEVLPDQLMSLVSSPSRRQVVEKLLDLGFRYVTVDLQGFSSGSMNRTLVSIGTEAHPGTDLSESTRSLNHLQTEPD
jgi:uncharacterized protein